MLTRPAPAMHAIDQGAFRAPGSAPAMHAIDQGAVCAPGSAPAMHAIDQGAVCAHQTRACNACYRPGSC